MRRAVLAFFPVLTLVLTLALPHSPQAEVLIAGSANTMPRFTESWVEIFNARGGVQAVLERRGTSTAPAALQSGRAQIASMARPMNKRELQAFREARGREPLAIPVAVDTVAVLVHASNPLERLTLRQLDAIFSATRNCGGETDLVHWHDLADSSALGLPDLPSIAIYGPRPGSGTGEFFRATALCNGRFKSSLRVGSSPAATPPAVAQDPAGIGFVSRSHTLDGTRELSITHAERPHPLTRQLLLYVDRAPEAEFAAGVREFLRFALSAEAQLTVESAGYLPLPRKLAERTLDRLR